MNINFKIYALVEKNKNTYEYIGLTSKPLKKRLSQHIYTSSKNLTKKDKWILSVNKQIDIVELESGLTKNEAISLERAYIDQIGLYNLKNTSLGGEVYLPEYYKGWLNKPISKYSKDGIFIESYESCSKAALVNNLSISTICYCANNTNITTLKHIYIYHGDIEMLNLKLSLIQSKNYKLYDFDGNVIDVNSNVNQLLYKNNLGLSVREFSKRLNNGIIHTNHKSKYFILYPDFNLNVMLNSLLRYKIKNIKTNEILYFESFLKISKFLKCSESLVSDVYTGIKKSVKGYIVSKINDDFKEYKDDRKFKIALIKNNEIVEIFNSIQEASDKFNIDPSGISKVCRGKRKTIKKLIFKYFNDIV